MQSWFFNLYAKIVLRNPWISIISVCIIAAVMAMGLPNFKLDASADSLTLERDDHHFEYLRRQNLCRLLILHKQVTRQ